MESIYSTMTTAKFVAQPSWWLCANSLAPNERPPRLHEFARFCWARNERDQINESYCNGGGASGLLCYITRLVAGDWPGQLACGSGLESGSGAQLALAREDSLAL